MAEPAMMNFFDIFLLFILSASGTMLLYIFYSQYERAIHLKYVKEVVFSKDSEVEALLAKKYQTTDKQSLLAKLRSYLLLAGIKLPVWLYLLFVLVFVGVVDFLVALFLQHWAGFVIGTPFGLLLSYMFLMVLIRNRKKEFNRALALAISVLVKMMKNGIGFEQALSKSISVSGSKLLKEVFSDFFQEKNTVGEMQAFENMYKHVDSKELKIFALAIKIGRESGGQFSNTLAKVEQTITYRKKMQDKVDVVTREGNFGSYVVVGIAVLLYFMLNSNFDGKIHQYFMESEYGRFQLLGIILWIFLGMLANNFITKVDK
ncbi:hypothetical protein [Sulfurimonas sp. C5]|uniref:type II secretion system F family protein n=1 Tax=Sulfurimonas sp. C5 TaxID=3036947 RepID=UPI0024561259|nr:hypothetical protein [Sulfurimonas sp. C5]MDH4944305.1 hypothetical protein [Sulfurimonas sp. C5]